MVSGEVIKNVQWCWLHQIYALAVLIVVVIVIKVVVVTGQKWDWGRGINSFSNYPYVDLNWKWKCELLNFVRLFVTPWAVAHRAPLSMEFSRQECWGGLLFPSPGDLPNPRIKPESPALQADSLPSEPQGIPLMWRIRNPWVKLLKLRHC